VSLLHHARRRTIAVRSTVPATTPMMSSSSFSSIFESVGAGRRGKGRQIQRGSSTQAVVVVVVIIRFDVGVDVRVLVRRGRVRQ
jgi:hypothetical protein